MELTAVEALHALRDALNTGHVDTVPDGWMTTEQWAAAWGLSRPHAGSLLKQGTAAGTVELRRFRIETGSKVYPVPHYRVRTKR
jgi:hypothetical protein